MRTSSGLRHATSVIVVVATTLLSYPCPSQEPDSLTPVAIELIEKLDLSQPVMIEAFVSPKVPARLQSRTQHLLILLEEVSSRLGERASVVIHPTEPSSSEAARANQRFDIHAMALHSDDRGTVRSQEVFLGVALTSGLDTITLPYLGNDVSVEHEIVRALYRLGGAPRKRLGVISTEVDVRGKDASTDLSGMGKKWPLIREIEKFYDVIHVAPSRRVDSELDVLLVIQPSSLEQTEIDNLVQAILAGQPTILFEDPQPVLLREVTPTSQPCQGRGSMFLMQPTEPTKIKGDLAPLWDCLGIEFSATEVVWQDYNPYARLNLPNTFVFVDSRMDGSDPFNRSQTMTSPLRHVLFPSPGYVKKTIGSNVEFLPLVRSSRRSGTTTYQDITRPPVGTSSLDGTHDLTATDSEYTLAARCRGTADIPDSDPRDTLDVLVVADVDTISPAFIQMCSEAGASNANPPLILDNLVFVLNAIDVLAGEERFAVLRQPRGAHPIVDRSEEEIAIDRRESEMRKRIQKEFESEISEETKRMETAIDEMKAKWKDEGISEREMVSRLAMHMNIAQRRLDVRREQLLRERDEKIQEFEHRVAGERHVDDRGEEAPVAVTFPNMGRDPEND